MIYLMSFFIVCILLFIFYLYKHKKKYYSYHVDKDYTYNMETEPYKVEMNNNSLKLPEEIDINDTVFCKVKIQSKLLGHFSMPNVRINGKKESAQYFEVGVNGYRYLNLTDMFQDSRNVNLIPYNCTIKNETIELYRYKKEDISDKKILIVAPHPDDAELSSYGLYSRNAKNIFVLTITGGEQGEDAYHVFNEKEKNDFVRMKLRTWNSVTVPMLANVPTGNLLNLGYADNSLIEMYENKETYFEMELEKINMLENMNSANINFNFHGKRNWYTLIADIKQIIDKVKPEIIISPHPYLDSHTDHIYSTVAVIEVIKEINHTNGRLFLYTIHNAVSPYYPFGKMKTTITLPPLYEEGYCLDRLYSFQLNEDEQANKILAFEAMHDLRLGIDILIFRKVLRKIIKTLKYRTLDIEKDYYNRFIRENELFCVVPFSKVENITIYSPKKEMK